MPDLRRPDTILIVQDLGQISPNYTAEAVNAYYEWLRAQYAARFKGVETIEGTVLQSTLRELMASSPNPVISLDDTFIDKGQVAGNIEVSRAVQQVPDGSYKPAGYMPRPGKLPLEDQLATIAVDLQDGGIQQVALADEVIFSGGTAMRYVRLLEAQGFTIANVYAAITTQAAVELFAQQGISLVAGRVCSPEVLDIIMAHDATLTYRAGRPVEGSATNERVLYADPDGMPEDGLSISVGVGEFCIGSLRHALRLHGLSTLLGTIGNFVGYDPRVTLGEAIDQRIEEIVRGM